MIICKNCGHEAHCGNPLRKAIDRLQPLKEIEVCKTCRCSSCQSELFWESEDVLRANYVRNSPKKYSKLSFHDQSNWDW